MNEAQTILEAVGQVLAEHRADMAQRLADHRAAIAAEQQEARAACAAQMAEALAALPEPAPGRDGADRVMCLPRYVKAGESCDANVIAWANAGIWQSVRATSGGPADDPAGWKCLVPGVAAIETREDWKARELVIGLRMSDGTLHECRGRMPATLLPADYLERGWGVLAGDTVRPVPDQPGEDIELLALVDGAALGEPAHWHERRLRGFRGQKGPPGDRGPAGPGLAGLALGRVKHEGGERLAIMPRFADPAIKAEPIPVDLLADDPAPGLAPIVGYAGPWNAARTYGRGVVVSAVIAGQPRQALSLRSDNTAPLGDARAWQVM